MSIPAKDSAENESLGELGPTVAVTASLTRRIWRGILSDRLAQIGLVFLVLVTGLAILAPWVSPFDPDAADFGSTFAAPSGSHLLGTDQLGRDVLSRLLHAGRVSLLASLEAVFVGLSLGLVPGLIAGYVGGWFDGVASRIADLLLSFPSLILAIGIVAALGPGLTTAMFAVGVAFAPRIFRLVRGQVLVAKAETYVEAARSMGLPLWRVIGTHVLPSVWAPLVVQISFALGLALIVEASLSFLGLGVQPPQASWGVMIGTAKGHIERAPWLVFSPGFAIFLTVLSFNIVGDKIRDVMGRGSD